MCSLYRDFLCLPLILLGFSVFGQQSMPVERLHFETLVNEDGLSQGMVSCFLEDRTGFLWIGTKDGLNRYDGHDFKVFRHSEKDSNTLVGNYITSLCEDRDGMIWIGTIKSGITCFDPVKGQFMDLDKANALNNVLSSRSIRDIKQDSSGHIWVSSAAGLDYFDPQQKTGKQNELRVHSLATLTDKVPQNAFDIVYWGFRSDGSLELFLPGEIARIPLPWNSDDLSTSSVDIHTRCAFSEDDRGYPMEDEAHNRAFLLSKSGISVLDKSSGKISAQYSVAIDLTDMPKPVIDADATLWLRTDVGLCHYYPETNRLVKVMASNPGVVDSRFFNYHSAHISSSGVLWFGTFAYGILKHSTGPQKFGHISTYENHPMSISGIFETPENEVIAQAYQVKNPILCDLQSAAFLKPFTELSAQDGGLRNANSIVFDPPYAYLSHEHLFRVHLATGKADKFEIPVETPQLTFDPLFMDSKKRLWCADGYPSGKKRLCELDKTSGRILQSFIFPGYELFHEYRFVSDWLEDEAGNFWFGTLQGVYKFDPTAKRWTEFPMKDSSLGSQVVFSLCFDPAKPDEVLWVGTNGAGLKCLNMQTGGVITDKNAIVLPSQVVYGIESDAHNNLWVSTNSGLCLVDVQSGQVKIFSVADGLQASEFNRYAHLKRADGILLFGGVNGVNFFNPEDLYKPTVKANTVITGLKINNQPAAEYSSGKHPLHANSIEFTDHIQLPEREPMITFAFTYLDLTNPSNNRFQYMLSGFNDDWIDAGTKREATYTNLDPGDYTFMVRGRNAHGSWGEKVAQVRLTVPPAFWATWWFRSLIIVSLAAAFYSFYRYRLHQALKIERLRNAIAQDLHDDIGSTLSSISLYSTVMKTTSGELPEKTTLMLDKITENTVQMMESMNDIVWTISAENDGFEHVVNRMRAFSVNMCEARGVTLDFVSDANVESLKLDMVKRKNTYLILKEAVNNAMKYSQCRQLLIKIQRSTSTLTLLVQDDGNGIDEALAQQNSESLGGNGIRGMKARANEIGATLSIHSTRTTGTSIELRLKV